MSKCWNCNNELTTGDNPKHFGICNKCYDEMFKSSDTIIRSFTNKISDLEAELAEKDEEIERLKKEIKEPEEIWNANLAELKEEVKQKLAQEFTEKIDGMLKEKVKEKTIDLNNQIRLMQESQQIEIDKMQRQVNSYLKVIKAYNSNENQKAIEQLEKMKEIINKNYFYNMSSDSCTFDKLEVDFQIDNQINELKGKVKNEKCIK